jgi:hypothetical protein
MAFYAERFGFTIDYDTAFTEEYRVVQLTPPAQVLDPDRDGGVDVAAGVPAVARAHRAGLAQKSAADRSRTTRGLGASWSTRA